MPDDSVTGVASLLAAQRAAREADIKSAIDGNSMPASVVSEWDVDTSAPVDEKPFTAQDAFNRWRDVVQGTRAGVVDYAGRLYENPVDTLKSTAESMGKGIWDVVSYTGKKMRGEEPTYIDSTGHISFSSPKDIENAQGIAGLMAPAGFGRAALGGKAGTVDLGIFGSRNHAMMDAIDAAAPEGTIAPRGRKALDLAKSLFQRGGMDPDEITRMTGWQRTFNRSGTPTWRTEIVDAGAEIKPEYQLKVALLSDAVPDVSDIEKSELANFRSSSTVLENIKNAFGSIENYEKQKKNFRSQGMPDTPLYKLIDHPELFDFYPNLKTMNLRIEGFDNRTSKMDPGSYAGYYDANTKTIAIAPEYATDLLTKRGLNTLLHEINHAVADIEHLPKGGNPRSYRDPVVIQMGSNGQPYMVDMSGSRTITALSPSEHRRITLRSEEGGNVGYTANLGEIASRETERRRTMSLAERLKNPAPTVIGWDNPMRSLIGSVHQGVNPEALSVSPYDFSTDYITEAQRLGIK